MSCDEFKQLAAAYALGLLAPEEQKNARAHLDDCQHEGCLEALCAAEDDLAHLAKALVPIRPRPELWLEIDRLVDSRPRSVAVRLPWAPWAIAAVCLIVAAVQWSQAKSARKDVSVLQGTLASAGVSEQEARLDCFAALAESKRRAETQQRALAALDGSTVVAMLAKTAGVPAGARALWNGKSRQAFVMLRDMRKEPDKDYVLWVIRNKEAIAAGIVKTDAYGYAFVEIDQRLLKASFEGLALTLEPAGGGTVPRGTLLYLAKI